MDIQNVPCDSRVIQKRVQLERCGYRLGNNNNAILATVKHVAARQRCKYTVSIGCLDGDSKRALQL